MVVRRLLAFTSRTTKSELNDVGIPANGLGDLHEAWVDVRFRGVLGVVRHGEMDASAESEVVGGGKRKDEEKNGVERSFIGAGKKPIDIDE